ncbi:CobD/CbiB family cobalamin biosynthesis protein [Corynebacterium hansenii]|uniref:Cobalamin biosynthesis protein CobD n=1 Tax=Corynebacterium hansenii TaxID=394964 RepID=A0ABV7ZPZ5_9CORY|nr:CobD/CbiB family cobalamin biosynthesis protein [Corynebacterium hansenii]WJZ00456.1 cobalamin biosynthesis protein [Corynebacterium hansenii]
MTSTLRRRILGRAAALAAGFAADRVFGDPARHHPVAWFGTAAHRLEQRMWADSKPRGTAYAAALVGAPALAAALIARRAPKIALAAATWAALGGTTLARTGERMTDRLEARDLAASRELVPWLCSRDPAKLDLDGVARATVESLAENTSDAVSGTLLWGAVFGAPGVVAHRCGNTLDAMVGYRTPKWANFGWASAKFDDLINWVPARLTGAATVIAGPDRAGAWRAWRDDAPGHPSPNAGVPEASAAGALGVRLGGATAYEGGVEHRAVLGNGSSPTVADVRRAVTLTRRVQDITAAICVGGLLVAAIAAR